MHKRRFHIVLIVPSHYDNDGYIIQWRRSIIPSNSLASVYGLFKECADAKVLGPEVDIEIDPHDEMNSVIRVNASSAASARLARGSWVSSGCNRISFRVRSTSVGSFVPPGSRW